MAGIREIAKAYYSRASEEEQKLAEEFFARLDVNGDGKISRQDLKKYVSSSLSNEKVFEQLDENGDETLDFYEVLAVYYMVNKVVDMDMLVCNACWGLLSGPYFSCLLCLEKGPDTFHLCCACYREVDFAHHEHSSSYFLDHHSLLSVLRKRNTEERNTEAEKSQDKRDIEELREIARAHYEAGSLQVQILAQEFFESMDTDGDRRVDLSEFLEFMKQEGHAQMGNRYFFKELDRDGNGALDFWEVMTLYYIVKSGRPICDCCGNFIPGIYFSCVECFNKSSKGSFSLCRDCYRSAKCKHNHNGKTQFLDNYTLLEAQKDSALAQATGVKQNQARSHIPSPNSSNAIVPSPSPNSSNAIVRATYKMDKWKVSLTALELALSIGKLSNTLCTIL